MELTNFDNRVLLGAFAALVAYVYFCYRRTYSFWSSRGINGPTPLPFFGNMLPLFFESFKVVDQRNRDKYGKLYGYYDGTRPMLVTSDPEMIKKIYMTDFSEFSDHIEILSPDPIDTNSVLAINGADWKRVRSVMSTVFTTSKMKTMSEEMKACKKGFLENVAKQVASGKDIEPRQIFTYLQIDVAARCFYGIDLKIYDNPNSEFVECTRTAFAFNATSMFLMNNLPQWLFGILGVSVTLSEKSASYLKNFIGAIIKGRDNSSAGNRNDFLQIMLDARDDNAALQGKGMKDIEVLSNAVFLLAAAFDTSTTTMTVMSWLLALNQDKQQKLYEEIVRVVGADLDREVTYDDLAQLQYLEATVHETLRLYSVDVRGFRRAARDTTLPGTDVKLPKGTNINVAYYAMHYDTDYFDEPLAFRPERFLPENKDSLTQCSYMSFGAGPRMCVGIRFAMVAIKQQFAECVRRYKFVRCAKTLDEINFPVGAMMLNNEGIVLKMIPRQ